MMTWQLWTGSEDDWDSILLCAEDYSVFQSYSWGKLKSYSKWLPLRYRCTNMSGDTVGMAQLLLRTLPFGMVFLWVPGGIVFRFPNHNFDDLTEMLQSLISKLRSEYPWSLIRFHTLIPHQVQFSYLLNQIFLRPYCKINSGYSVVFKLNRTTGRSKDNVTANHRKNTKKAFASNITWSFGNSDKLLKDCDLIHADMVKAKQLPSIALSYEELKLQRDVLANKFLILIGYLDNKPVTSCLVLLFGNKAFYMVAATNSRGRDVSAAYGMFERLMEELTNRGVTEFDFGGIDPVRSSAVGVNYFKCGFGGQIVEQLGEWESAPSELFRVVINLAIRFRGARP